MKPGKMILLIGLFVFIGLLTACIDGNATQSSSDQEGSATNPETEAGEKVVNIGFSGPLSGASADYGEKSMNGLEMAAEEINAEGFEVNGETYKVNIVALDDKYLPDETASNAKRLVQEHETPIIYTPHSGGVFALQVFNEQDNFIIGAYSSEPSLTEQGNSLTVRIPPSYDGYIEPFTDYSMDRFGEKLAMIPPVTQYGQDWAEALAPYWEKKGGEVVFESSVDFAKDTDFFTLLTNALESDPDVLFIGGPSEPTANVAKQARQLGFEGGFIVMDQAKLDEMKNVTETYEILEGGIGTMPLVNADYPGAPAFVEKYQDIYNSDPGSEAGFHYLSLYVFVEAMKAAGTTEDATVIREHMQDALEALPEEKHVYVVPNILDGGGFDVNIRAGAVENGEIISISGE